MEKKKLYLGGIALVSGTMIANVVNLIFNLYLGRTLSLADFGELTFFTSLVYFTSIPLGSFSATTSHMIAHLYGKHSLDYAKGYYVYILRKTVVYGVIASLLWIMFSPFLSVFFKTRTPYMLLYFAPIWFVSIVSANFSGYLKGTLSFGKISGIALIESFSRFLFAFVFINMAIPQYAFVSVALSLILAMIAGWKFTENGNAVEIQQNDKKFNTKFLMSSAINGISVITFLSLDVLLVKHFLSPIEAGQYGLLSLVGKMTFFFGSLLGPFMIPLVSHNEGAKKGSRSTFLFLFTVTLLFSFGSFVGLGLLGHFIVPFIFKAKSLPILPLLPAYVFAMAVFTVTQPIVSFFQAKERYVFAIVGLMVSALQIVLMNFFHKNLSEVVWVMVVVSLTNLGILVALYLFENRKHIIYTLSRILVGKTI